MEPLVLTVDLAGLPQAWVDLEEAVTYHAKLMVAWSVGGIVREFRGGWQRNGTRSRIATKSILAIKGSAGRPLSHVPALRPTPRKLNRSTAQPIRASAFAD